MPKVAASTGTKLRSYVQEFGSDLLSTDGTILFCKICDKKVNFEKKYFISQHLGTSKHKAALARKAGEKKTCLISSFPSTSSKRSEFGMDLCLAFVDAGIPLWKLENKSLKGLFEKYTKEIVPSESSLRKTYLDDCYASVMQSIIANVKDHKIWVSIDETTDAVGRYVANVIVGTMQPDQSGKIYLLTSEQLEKTNGTTIAQLFTNALALLWPDGIKHDNVLLFVTDAAPYMKKAARALEVLFPKMIHMTCLAHALHRVAEEIRCLYPDIDILVNNAKKVFRKAPSRIHLFREMEPDLALPPQPVLTRWGTWISAAVYYADHFLKMTEIVDKLDEEEACSIRIVKELLSRDSIRNELSFIKAHFSKLPTFIISLEERNIPLVRALQLFNDVVNEIECVPGPKGRSVSEKLKRVVSANTGLEKVKNIAKVLVGESSTVIEMDPATVSCFKFAPITSVEVERSFSMLKHILSDRRQGFTFNNLKKHLVIMCNREIF